MAKIETEGGAVPPSGTRDGIVTYWVGSQLRQRRKPTTRYGANRSERILRNEEIFRMVQRHIRLHRTTLAVTMEHDSAHNAGNVYFGANKAPLRAALAGLADNWLATGEHAGDEEIELAIAAYAKTHPGEIVVVRHRDFCEQRLCGAWPTPFVCYGRRDGRRVEL
ncbi:MAG: hypothetical protein SPJ13_04600 [Bacteroidales bacterium]|nr:hypothetical protein [Bacteroidales bacterium]